MDCIFNTYIPKSTEYRFIIRPAAKTFVNGIAPLYNETYPPEISHYLSEQEYRIFVKKVNKELFYEWPCLFCQCFGYCFSLCTVGLSFCAPYHCIHSAEDRARLCILEYDMNYRPKGLNFRLVKKCSTSWIEIAVLHEDNQA